MNLQQAREQYELAFLNIRTQPILPISDQTKALWRTLNEAEEHLLACERLAAEAEGVPYAVEWQVEGEWPPMAMNPMLITGLCDAVLLFEGEGKTIQVVFPRHTGTSFTWINDEVISGHSLDGKGLQAYSLSKVVNSAWIQEIQRANSVHPQYDEAFWQIQEHYMLCFKDGIAEVITSEKPTWHSFPTRSAALEAALRLCGN